MQYGEYLKLELTQDRCAPPSAGEVKEAMKSWIARFAERAGKELCAETVVESLTPVVRNSRFARQSGPPSGASHGNF